MTGVTLHGVVSPELRVHGSGFRVTSTSRRDEMPPIRQLLKTRVPRRDMPADLG